MKNPYIEKVEEWLENPEAVTQKELLANKNSADTANTAYFDSSAPATDSYAASAASAAANNNAANAAYWVEHYHDLTGE